MNPRTLFRLVAGAAVVGAALVLNPAGARPILYGLSTNADHGGISGSLNGQRFSGAQIWIYFTGDTDYVQSFPSNPSAGGPTGFLSLQGTATVRVTSANLNQTVTVLPSAGVFFGVDNTNNGIGFGSLGTNPGGSGFPGAPGYPLFGVTASSSEFFKTYDLGVARAANPVQSTSVAPLAQAGVCTAVPLNTVQSPGASITCFNPHKPYTVPTPWALPTTGGDLILDLPASGSTLDSGVFYDQFTDVLAPFESFRATFSPDSGTLTASIQLPENGPGLGLDAQALAITIGDGAPLTLPVGSLVRNRKVYGYSGTGGFGLTLVESSPNRLHLTVWLGNANAPTHPFPLKLAIGNHVGTTTVRLQGSDD
jgi:hypothetical protein